LDDGCSRSEIPKSPDTLSGIFHAKRIQMSARRQNRDRYIDCRHLQRSSEALLVNEEDDEITVGRDRGRNSRGGLGHVQPRFLKSTLAFNLVLQC